MDPKKMMPFDYENQNQDDIEELELEILEKFDSWALAKKPFDAQSILNISLYTGRQYMAWSPSTGRLEPVEKLYKGQFRVTINKIQPKCRSAMARLVSRLPSARVVANSSDYEDMYGAQCAQALLDWNYRRKDQRMGNTVRQAALWSIVCGTSWIHDVWDPTYGKQVPWDYKEEPVQEQALDPETGEPLLDEQGQPMMMDSVDELDPQGRPMMERVEIPNGPNGEVRFEGKTKTVAVSPLQMFYDTTYTDWNDVIDCIQRDFVSKEWVKENIAGCEDIEEIDGLAIDDAYHMMYKTLTEGPGWSSPEKKGCEVLVYWCKRTMRFPAGLKCTLVNRKLKLVEAMPGLEGEELPYSAFPYITLMGSIRGMGLPEAMLDIQMGYNRASALILESAQTTAINKYKKRKDCSITEPVNDKIGQIVEVDDMQGLEAMPGQAIPQSLYQLRAALSMDFDDISMIHKASEGGTDPNVNSEDQLALQTENDNFANNPIMEAFQDAVCGSASRILKYYQVFAPPEMVIKIVGDEGIVSYKSFKISAIANNTDVYMEPASMVNQTYAGRTKSIQMILQSPIIQMADPPRRDALIGMAMKHLSAGENKQAMNEVNAQQKAAEDNCQLMADGQDIAVMPWYDFKIHKEITEIRMLSPEFKSYDEMTRNRFIGYWTALQMEIQKEMMMAQQAAMMAGGGPGGPGGPSGPPGVSGAEKSHPPGFPGGIEAPETEGVM